MQPAASPMQSAISGTGTTLQAGQRERFAADELAIVLSHYDIGVIESIQEFPRGSRKAPKLLITSEQGRFLLKRRAHGKDDPYKVAFAHALQLYLAGKQFPLPHLIGTRKDNNSMLAWHGSIYELFEYISGQAYPMTLEATAESGRVLALFHKLLADFRSEWQPPTGSYHMQPMIERGLKAIPKAIGVSETLTTATVNFLLEAYHRAAERADSAGLETWPKQIAHGDWHPGNMLFRDDHIVAVIDYDSARLLPRIIDIANGALQFSIISGDDDVSRWPDYVDESRLKRFVRGYDGVMLLSEAEVRILPWLMCEALIAEAVLPIAMTGSFGRMEGLTFLQMVQRKVNWLAQSADHIVRILEE